MELSDELKDFIFPKKGYFLFSHRTADEAVARKIMDEGFRYADSFQKTTDHIIDDIVYIRYWDSLRKYYGTNIVIIGIAEEVFRKVSGKLRSKHEVQQALSSVYEERNEEDDTIFLLPRQYVKGYLRRDSGEIFRNPEYNPDYLPENLDENIENLNTH